MAFWHEAVKGERGVGREGVVPLEGAAGEGVIELIRDVVVGVNPVQARGRVRSEVGVFVLEEFVEAEGPEGGFIVFGGLFGVVAAGTLLREVAPSVTRAGDVVPISSKNGESGMLW